MFRVAGPLWYLKFLMWSSTPLRCRVWVRAWWYVRAWVDEPQFTSGGRTHAVRHTHSGVRKCIYRSRARPNAIWALWCSSRGECWACVCSCMSNWVCIQVYVQSSSAVLWAVEGSYKKLLPSGLLKFGTTALRWLDSIRLKPYLDGKHFSGDKCVNHICVGPLNLVHTQDKWVLSSDRTPWYI